MRPLRAGIRILRRGAQICAPFVGWRRRPHLRRDNPLWLSFAGLSFRRRRCESFPETGGSRIAGPPLRRRIALAFRNGQPQGAAPTAPSPIDNHPVGVVRERSAINAERRGTHICVPYKGEGGHRGPPLRPPSPIDNHPAGVVRERPAAADQTDNRRVVGPRRQNGRFANRPYGNINPAFRDYPSRISPVGGAFLRPVCRLAATPASPVGTTPCGCPSPGFGAADANPSCNRAVRELWGGPEEGPPLRNHEPAHGLAGNIRWPPRAPVLDSGLRRNDGFCGGARRRGNPRRPRP